MGTKPKVFWYCEKWQPGGIQMSLTHLLKHIKEAEFDVVVSQSDVSLFDVEIEKYGARKIVSLGKMYRRPEIRILANIIALRRIIKEGNYDVAHFNVCHGVELIYTYWAWRYRIPIRIAHCRNNDIGSGGKSRELKIHAHRICKQLFANCSNVKLANSDLAAKWLFTENDLQKNKVRIVKNGIESERFAFNAAYRKEMRSKLNLGEAFTIGHVGHFSYQKNHEFLIEIFKNVVERIPNAKLILVGIGDLEETVRDKVDRFGLSNQVIFYGMTKNVEKVMSAMDAFVMPSRFEGFGNVLLEAQANGLKCYASEGVIPQSVQITDLLERISLNQSAQHWAERICTSAEGYVRKSHIDEVCKNGYDIADMARRIEEIYKGGATR